MTIVCSQIFISKIVNNERLQVYGNGNQTRTYCYITDAMNGFIRVLLKGNRGEPYNIGNSQPELSVLNLVKYLEKILPDQKINYDIIDHPILIHQMNLKEDVQI